MDGQGRDGCSLGERTSGEVEGRTVLLPLGSTEQHGPHLPLDTDARLAEAVARAVAAELRARGDDVLVAPPLAYGASGEHEGFAGTVSIGTEALALVLIEYGRSISAWARRLVMVNGHGGNLEAVARAVELLRHEGRDVSWAPCAPEPTAPAEAVADAHAGHTETSLLLHLAPELVRRNLVEAGERAPLTEILPRLREGGVRAVSPNGVLGDPRGASPEEGARLFDAIVRAVLARMAHDDAREERRRGEGPA